MKKSDFCKSSYYVGSKNKLLDFCKNIENCKQEDSKCNEKSDKDFENWKQKIRLELKNYLELNNVSFLFGTGSSMILNSVSIRDIPEKIEDKIKEDDNLYKFFVFLIKNYQKDMKDYKIDSQWIVRKCKSGVYRYCNEYTDEGKIKYKLYNIATPMEQFLDYLLGLKYISGYSKIELDGLTVELEKLDELINKIKKELFILCDLENLEENKTSYYDNLKYHKKFVKALLGRPLNLRRANIFTTNYDLAFENAFDELGVNYINGFCGFNRRYFKPEVFDFDMYYPGNMTEGKVRRVEKVIKYFKLHGSLTWVKEQEKPNNIYGLREFPIGYLRERYYEDNSKIGEVIIYPNSYKKGYTLDFPYSELFRQFAATITQPQSVLFCVGYSFYDEHINDIIYQALSIPSFTLVIVDYNGTKNDSIRKLKELNDPRIIILEGPYLGDFKIFADEIMPNFYEIDVNEKVAETLGKLYPDVTDNKEGEKGE